MNLGRREWGKFGIGVQHMYMHLSKLWLEMFQKVRLLYSHDHTCMHTQANTLVPIRCVARLPFMWISQRVHELLMTHLYSPSLMASNGTTHTPMKHWADRPLYYFFLTCTYTWHTPLSWVFEYIMGILIAKLAGWRQRIYSEKPLHLALGGTQLSELTESA